MLVCVGVSNVYTHYAQWVQFIVNVIFNTLNEQKKKEKKNINQKPNKFVDIIVVRYVYVCLVFSVVYK